MINMRSINLWIKANFTSDDYFELVIDNKDVMLLCHYDDKDEEILNVYKGIDEEDATTKGLELYKKLQKKYNDLIELDNLND